MNEYDTTQIRVPSDYGVAVCICGTSLNNNKICPDCHIQFFPEDTIFWNENREV